MKSLTPLQIRLETLVQSPADRGRVLAAVIATSVVSKLSMPSNQVESAQLYYADNHNYIVGGKLSEVNEGIIYDVVYADELVRKIWLMRYNAAFAIRPNPTQCGCFFSALFAIADQISDEDRKFLDKYSCEIFELRTFFENLVAQ